MNNLGARPAGIDWEKIRSRYEEINAQLVSPTLDNSKRLTLQKEMSYLSKLLDKHREIESLEKELRDLEVMRSENKDQELESLLNEEIEGVRANFDKKSKDLNDALFPPDEMDTRSAFLEIRAGTGGQEASLFAADMARMYTNYAIKKNWHVGVVDSSETDLGGFREIILHIEGKNVYGHLKRESGVHRVQRVPATETAGRVHTSTATVAVLPEAEEIDVSINPADLRIDTYRAGGAGGQHVNKTESAIRITHLPTGIVVACQDERSQHKNKAKAMKMLQSKILSAQKEKQEAEVSQKRKDLVGTGQRAEKVRTYNYPQNRITDHQVELTLNKLDIIMEGNLDEIIDALMAQEKEERHKKPLVFGK